MSSAGGPGRGPSLAFGRAPLAILVVDPDPTNANHLTQSLKGRFTVAVVGSKQAAEAALAAGRYDLLVIELDLPDGDGTQLIATLHAAPATRHLLLMVVSRRESVRDKIAAFQAGADDYLVKPVDPQLFEMRIQLLSRFRQLILRP